MATAATVGSCFSSTITPSIRSKLVASDTALLKVACSRASRILATANHAWRAAPFHETRQRLRMIRSAVAEEEVAAVAVEEAVKEEVAAVAEVEEEAPPAEVAEVEEEAPSAEVAEVAEVEEEAPSAEVAAVAEVEEEAPPAPPPPEAPSTKLYFGNLPYNCDSAQLAGIVQEYATPEIVEVLYNSDTGRSRGFAFVTMNSVEDCELVIKNLEGIQYGGRTLRVNFSDKPKPKLPLYPESEFKLFVGNLSWSVTSESLTKVFEEYGNVVGARVLYDGDTGRSRGYGFVCYSTKEEMDAAMESLEGVELEGRNLRISLALGKRN